MLKLLTSKRIRAYCLPGVSCLGGQTDPQITRPTVFIVWAGNFGNGSTELLRGAGRMSQEEKCIELCFEG